MAEPTSREITRRELRNDPGSILRSVERGGSFVITRNGSAIGELIQLRRRTFVARDQVAAAFRTAATFDADRFRRDLDDAVDQDASSREW